MTESIDRQHKQQSDAGEGAGTFLVGALAFATGVLVGIAVGILVAPHSGAYTRRRLQNLAEDVKERASGLAADAKEAAEAVVAQGKRMVN